MNANDLADRLEEFYKGTHITKAAEELRRLYANPVKELTDEEIEQVWTEVTCQELNVPYSFARAILRKSQEK